MILERAMTEVNSHVDVNTGTRMKRLETIGRAMSKMVFKNLRCNRESNHVASQLASFLIALFTIFLE